MSVLIEFEKLNNTRDLGGMEADGGKIRHGMLYRSGFLQKASEKDLEKLKTFDIGAVVDFRSGNETREQPDPLIGSEKQIHLPAEDEQALGIERDEEAKKRVGEILIDRVIADPDYANKYMSGLYRRFVSNTFTAGQYRKFIQLLEEEEKPVLWHCTAGKDRAGFGAILLEEILGVDREAIRADYLKTNGYIREEVDFLVDMFEKMRPQNYPKKEVRLFFSAEPYFFDSIYDEAENKYGSFDNYMKTALGVDDTLKEKLKERYLV